MSTTNCTPQLLTSEQAAKVLGLRPQTLTLWRYTRRRPQPRYIRVGTRAIKYRHDDLLAFLDRQTVYVAAESDD